MPIRRARGGRASCLLVGVAMVLAACGGISDSDSASDATAQAPAPGEPVLVIGDSLTVGARVWGDLKATLGDAGWDAEIVADDGRWIGWGVDEVRARRDVPATVVVALGTNSGASAETFAADVTTMVDELTRRGATTIVWLAPTSRDGTIYAARVDALRALAGGALHVPDWPAELEAHPEWFGGDGLHLTTEGYRNMARFVRDALAEIAGPPA